jgi:hypothetical protein
MKKLWIAAMLVSACGGDDDAQSGESSADDSSIPDGGPCGIAGGPLATDELHTPQIGADAMGRPAVNVELHEAGTCNGEPAAAVASVVLDTTTDTISVGTAAIEISTPADYHDEHYWWDALGVDAEVVHTETDVTIIFHHGTNAPMVVCAPATTAVSCS